MTFSTSLYKFYPCLQSWSIYSSMAHITIGHTVISLWILTISLLCAFPPTHVPLPCPKGCLYSSFILLVSLLCFFLPCLSSWWVGWFCTSHSLKNSPFGLFHWTKSYSSDMHSDWNSLLSKRATYLLRGTYFGRIWGTKASDGLSQKSVSENFVVGIFFPMAFLH